MSRRVNRVAILGATGHVAKGLIRSFIQAGDLELSLLARSPQRVEEFVASIGGGAARVLPMEDFAAIDCDTVINCVGIGSPMKHLDERCSVFELTRRFDDLVLGYLDRSPDTLYVSLSSGAAYGTDFLEPASETSQARFNANRLDRSEQYGIAKLHSEALHRSLGERNIADLRIFGYFSRFIDLGERFLLSEMASCMKSGETFVTGPQDIWRDFVGPDDLAALIRCLMRQERVNDVFDVYSAAPASKFQIIEHFAASGCLNYRVEGGYSAFNVTGAKERYYSENRRAENIGYMPRYTTLQSIEREIEAIRAAG